MPRLVALLLFLLVAGCARESDGTEGLLDTFAQVRGAGFDWTSVELWRPAEDVYEIHVEIRTTEEDEAAASRAAKLVWATHEGPLDRVSVHVNGDYRWSLGTGGLKSRFGPRGKTPPEPWGPSEDTWILIWSVVLGVVGLFAVGLIVVKLVRRARS
jgi:hypothetical protein